MENIQELLESTEQRALAIAKLLQLIEMDTKIIQRLSENNPSDLYIEQYYSLRSRNIESLQNLMQLDGFSLQLSALSKAA